MLARYSYLLDLEQQQLKIMDDFGLKRLIQSDDEEAENVWNETNKTIDWIWEERYKFALSVDIRHLDVIQTEYDHLIRLKARTEKILDQTCKESQLIFHDDYHKEQVEKWSKMVQDSEDQIKHFIYVCFEKLIKSDMLQDSESVYLRDTRQLIELFQQQLQ